MARTEPMTDGTGNITEILPGNAEFTMKDGFLTMTSEGHTYPRIILRRAFPYADPERFISVFDGEMHEIGTISDLAVLPDGMKETLRAELERAYYLPQITHIFSMKEKFGFSNWRVSAGGREVQFTLQDTYRSILHITDRRLLIQDVEGNRFEIPDTEALDASSHRFLELYL